MSGVTNSPITADFPDTNTGLSRPAGPQRRRPAFRYRVKRVVVYSLLVLGLAPTMLPFVWLVRSSLMGPDQIFIAPPEWIPDPFVWSNFPEALSAQPFLGFFLNTMIIEVLVVIGTLLSSSVVAFSFARLRWPGRNAVFAILLSTLMLPYAVTLVPTFLMWDYVGALNTFIPLTVPAWFAGIATGGVFNVFLLRQFFLTIPFELDEAAYIDGATPWRVYWKIILPLSRPALVVVTIFTFIFVWNDFLGPLVYLNDERFYTLAIGLASFQGNYTSQWEYLMAASTAVIAPVIILYFFGQRYFIQGVTLTGLKS